VTARDSDGREAVTLFRIAIGNAAAEPAPAPEAPRAPQAPTPSAEPRSDAGDADAQDQPAKTIKHAQRNEPPAKRIYSSFSEQLKRAKATPRDPLLARIALTKAHVKPPVPLA